MGNDVVWALEPHTKAKHEILKYYLGAWFPILASVHERIIYFDGFAGPGEYLGGEDGSPIIALKVAQSHMLRDKFRKELVFFFVEIDKARSDNLKKKIEEMSLPPNFRVKVECEDFESCVGAILRDIAERGKQLAPSFFFIDPFGPTGFSMPLIQTIANQPRSEVLITFNYQSLNQWFLPDESKHDHVDRLFGSDIWRKANDIVVSKEREDYLRLAYKNALENLGWKVRAFCMINKHNQTQYYLFFATRNPLGMMAMKRAMWKSAPTGDFKYSDLSNPAQGSMLEQVFEEQYSQQLAVNLYQNHRGGSVPKQRLLQDDLAWHPICIGRHLTRALRILEVENTPPLIVNVAPRQKRGSYPENCVVTFAP